MRDLTPLPDLANDTGFTGQARTRRPVYVDLLPPCNAGCPAGENIQAWLAVARDSDYERAWRLQARRRRGGAALANAGGDGERSYGWNYGRDT